MLSILLVHLLHKNLFAALAGPFFGIGIPELILIALFCCFTTVIIVVVVLIIVLVRKQKN